MSIEMISDNCTVGLLTLTAAEVATSENLGQLRKSLRQGAKTAYPTSLLNVAAPQQQSYLQNHAFSSLTKLSGHPFGRDSPAWVNMQTTQRSISNSSSKLGSKEAPCKKIKNLSHKGVRNQKSI
jgi:hypothetical protein